MSNISVFFDYQSQCREAAARIAELIRNKPDAVLGLATGSTPIGVYQELVRLHREENLDFSRVTTFNLDEYYPMEPDAPQSYHRFMREHLFDHINCNNWHVPSGEVRNPEQIENACREYEKMIQDAGGLDLQLLGIGRTGHIGFNEPGSPLDSKTRLVLLDYQTRADAANDFFGLDNVPVRAITMGIGTIMAAREVLLLANGTKKAAIVHEALEGKITSKVPASLLREHPNARFLLDKPAAAELTEYARPWLSPNADFRDLNLRRRALIAASSELDKSLPKLTANDLQQVGLAALVHQMPSLEAAIQEVERDLQSRLDDNRFIPQNSNIVCLSPHPDDDVICCGATLYKMNERGNHVTIAYGVSGSNAVRDKDVLAMLRTRHPRLASYVEANLTEGQSYEDAFDEIRQFLFEREPGQPDNLMLRNLKRLVREGEASDACHKMGATPRFLDLPFYYSNEPKTHAVTDSDVAIMLQMLRDTQPGIVMLTGESSDPHGTHDMCAEAFERAAKIYLQEGGKPFIRWQYRGAWEEYQAGEGDFYSVFDKQLMEIKIGLILDHISQLDPMFPGTTDPREFYERARDRNRATARELQQLGVLPPSRSFDPIYAEAFQVAEK
jgi:glucosamine-6-phosphate deaminase